VNHFPISDTNDSAYSEWLEKHSLPPYLGQPCSFAFTLDNDEVIFKGKFVNPATHSDLLVAGKGTLRTPFCVLFSDKECKRYSTTQTNKAVKLSHKIDLIAAIIAHVSIHDMLGLDSLAPLPQVQASFKETIKIVHPDKNNGVVVCGESQATQKLNDAFNVYKDAHDVQADNARPIHQRPRAVAPSAFSSRSIGQGQAAPDVSSPAAASAPAPQPQSNGPAQGTSAVSDNNIFSHCIIAEDNTSFHNWDAGLLDAGLQFLSDKEIFGKLFELGDFTFTSALPVGRDRTKFLNCMKKVLVRADIFQDSIRARDTLRHLARSLPTLLLSHGFTTIQTRCNRLLKGDLEWLWASCTNLGRTRQTRLAANPHTGKARTATQLDTLGPLRHRNWPGQAISPSLVRQCARIQHRRWVLTLLQSYRPKTRRGVWILTKLFGPPPRIWMLYATKMIGGVSPKNTFSFLLTTYANILPVLLL